MLPIHTILYPTDFSENARYALPLACSLARDHGAQLIILHVDLPPVSHGEEVARRQDGSYREQLWRNLQTVEPPDSSIYVERVLAEGDPVAEILCVAQEYHCDLIVMGTHGRTGLRRLLMGSVAEEVVRKAPCPVVTVKNPIPVAQSVPAVRQQPVGV